MNKLKRYLLYAGLEKEQYKLTFPDIHKRNLQHISVYSAVLFFYYLIFMVYAISLTGFDVYYLLYVSDSVILAALYFVTKRFLKLKEIKPWMSVVITYIFMATLYIDAIIITCYNYDMQSTGFFVRLVILPVLCMDTPIRMICFQIMFAIVFIIVTPFYNLPSIVKADNGEMVSYITISIIMCIFLTSIHVKEIFREREAKYLSHFDILTGVKNRNSFEEEINRISQEQLIPGVFCIYADVNGLHEMNNTRGHEAGDKMLITIASGLKDIFGEDHSYRIGGDEFVAFSYALSKTEIEKSLAIFSEDLVNKGYHVSFGIVGTDENYNNIQELIKTAETRMYLAKKQYYAEKGVPFSSRK